jgi:DNA sulfur modification protein DndE
MMTKAIITLTAILIGVTSFASETIWLIGDSTVASYGKKYYPLTGWGQMLQNYCKPGVVVKNKAVGGRSTKSFIDEKRWDKILPELKKGDFLLIQFGHNDQKKSKPKVYAPANGAYKNNLKKFISEAREKGVTPILVTSVCRRVYHKKTGEFYNSLGQYPAAMKQVAEETKTPVIDLNSISFKKFKDAGKEGSKKIFNHLPPGKYKAFHKGKKDNSHFCESGAKIIAGWVVADAKKQNIAVAELFK